jgi:hypothetical protein
MIDDCPYILIPQVSIHPDRINITTQCHWFEDRRHGRSIESILLSDHKHHDKMSSQAMRKVQKAVKYLLFFANEKKGFSHVSGNSFKFKISFITLTLASTQMHDDNVIKAVLLNQFLIEAKMRWKVSNYVWRAEKQSNGNIHFHVLTDKFIPWNELRNVWNRIQNKLGYVDRYRAIQKAFYKDGFKLRKDLVQQWPEREQKRAYVNGSKNGWNSPNSTDIHSLRHVHKIADYITKYLQKDSQTKGLIGRLWGCSSSLCNIKGAQTDIDGRISSELDKLRIIYKPFEVRKDHFSILFVNVHQIIKAGCTILSALIIDYFATNFSHYIQLIT